MLKGYMPAPSLGVAERYGWRRRSLYTECRKGDVPVRVFREEEVERVRGIVEALADAVEARVHTAKKVDWVSTQRAAALAILGEGG